MRLYANKALVPNRWYEVNGEFAKYSPVRTLRPAGDESWEVETEYELPLTIPTTDIVAQVGNEGDDSPIEDLPEVIEAKPAASQPGCSYTLLSSVKPQPVEWLWPDRIPLGELTIFDGDPGTNKSSIALDLAARVSTGREMPDGTPGMHGGVVLLQAEDSLNKTVPLRAQAAGADLSRMAVVEDVTVPDDLSTIRKAVAAVKAKLIIIDPLMCFVTANANKEQAVRRALTPLRNLADRHNIAIAVIRHLNKSGGRNALYRGGGSIGITATVRSEFLVAPSPDDEHLRVLAHVKSNLGPKTTSLLFEPVGTDGGVRIEWRGECDYSAADLLSKPKDARPAMDKAVELLVKSLDNGSVEANEVRKVAEEADVSLRTLERAKAELKVISKRQGFGPRSSVFWELPEPDSKDT